jgi:predicted  nucleic acid-binding Zn-ribbon protein
MKKCPDCGSNEFRYLYPTGDKTEKDSDLIICIECGADAPEGITNEQIIND